MENSYQATYKNVPGQDKDLILDFQSPKGTAAVTAAMLLLRTTGLSLEEVQDVEVEVRVCGE
jgi:hypothetical protein